ncbi:NEQ133 [Nanoarchaeum equitans Kin4-M]|uniref:Cell division protein FtsZ n=1 Tax=Nanoarchaeum equitans (strain Kin4-M) TaxID=228908 RepID=Q74ML8_NANEQ|nr:NEQ133 [Nanoarchaeum equitans Kin4-M]
MEEFIRAAQERAKMDEKQQIDEYLNRIKKKIKVIGVGGAGCNTINRLYELGLQDVELIAVNADVKDLAKIKAHKKVLIGEEVTRGLGTGRDPELGEQAARESEKVIKELLQGTDMVFITFGLGGGTGTGAGPVIADIAKQMGILTVAVVSWPFSSEGNLTLRNAQWGLARLEETTDTHIVIPNDKLLEIAPNLPIAVAFKLSDEVLANTIKKTTELILKPGQVTRDFADLKVILENGGLGMVGFGESDSENKALEAIERAINNPLLDTDVSGAKRALLHIVAGPDFKTEELNKILEYVSNKLDPEAKLLWGLWIEEEKKGKVEIMILVTELKNVPDYLKISEKRKKKDELGIDVI